MATVLILGASRGIGHEFARQYAADGARVIGTHRQPEAGARLRALGVRPLALDVLDPAAPNALGALLAAEALDLVIVAAGVYGPQTNGTEAPDAAAFDAVMQTNVRAPMQAIAALAPALVATRGKLVVISSRMGSIGLMTSPSGWLYRASKAALNAALRATSLQWGPQGVICLSFHPGWVRTDMGGAGADLDVADSVSQMRRVIDAANASHNGKFLNYNGEQLAW